MSESADKKPNLIFIFPSIYKPERLFSVRFKLHSEWSSGYIFSQAERNLHNYEMNNYHLYALMTTKRTVFRNFIYSIRMINLILKTIQGRPPVDAVIVYDPLFTGICGTFLKFWLKTKLIVELNGNHELLISDTKFIKKILKKSILKLSTYNADSIKLINSIEKDYFSKIYPQKPIYKFMDFVECSSFLNLKANQGHYLLSIGFPFKLKGMDVLIQAFDKISKYHPTLELKIMGHCPENELEYFKSLTSNNKIHFIKPGDIRDLLKDCYAFVSASQNEAGGRAIVEAMCCKKPIISTSTYGGLELVKDKKNGLLCAINDPDDLAEKIDILVRDSSLSLRLGLEGYKMVLDLFDEPIYDYNYKTLINEIISPRNQTQHL